MAWWEWDLITNHVQFDDKKATMLGYTLQEFPKDVYEICNLIHPDDYELTMQIMRDHLTGKTEQWEATYRIRRKDGSYSWYYDCGKASDFSENGKPSKVMGVVIDVSRLKEVEKELQFNKNILLKVLDNSPLGKTMVDANGLITNANKPAEKIFGITQCEILERNYDASQWKISDLVGNPIPVENLPFNLIK